MKKVFVFFVLLLSAGAIAQQLNCSLTVNAQKLNNTNQQVFKTLETSLKEFVNTTDWTGQTVQQHEKINCSIFITILSHNSNQFSATIQVQSSRPIYNSSYSSPVLNFNDKNFDFNYTEYENLNFNPNGFSSNLVSVISFYSYLILGMDADTFVLESGTDYLVQAQNIANIAQQSSNKGWSQSDGNDSRYFLINDLLSPTYAAIRKTELEYHTGLDLMAQDLKSAKEKVKMALLNLTKLNAVKPNAFLTRTFFDAKSDEIVSVFSGGPSIDVTDLTESLNRVSPMNSSKWATITF
ncbi:DUF4835 family protein [Flavobacterium crassostreae]|uniref:DUF4835 domain-containing protein n=1 Tax=Flavobacterium crassostreae TaxID=1763534 RepID=A0A1B9E9K2_9FLAO|nr:DUF4835 family protein [Flavobacterium crassostreae]OCB78613.1 hypothetical protein LPBF_01040 [Flavobacterium crassostreae]